MKRQNDNTMLLKTTSYRNHVLAQGTEIVTTKAFNSYRKYCDRPSISSSSTTGSNGTASWPETSLWLAVQRDNTKNRNNLRIFFSSSPYRTFFSHCFASRLNGDYLFSGKEENPTFTYNLYCVGFFYESKILSLFYLSLSLAPSEISFRIADFKRLFTSHARSVGGLQTKSVESEVGLNKKEYYNMCIWARRLYYHAQLDFALLSQPLKETLRDFRRRF